MLAGAARTQSPFTWSTLRNSPGWRLGFRFDVVGFGWWLIRVEGLVCMLRRCCWGQSLLVLDEMARRDRGILMRTRSADDTHSNRPAAPAFRRAFSLISERHGPELVRVPAVGALGVEGPFPKGSTRRLME